jgi:hypothetical protein
VNGNSLQKTAGGAAWNAGASSSTQLNAGDGGAQIQVESTTGYRMFGLSNADPNQDYASIKYGVDVLDGGALYVYESGVLRGQIGTCAVGDLLRIAVSGGVVQYSRQAAGSGVWNVLYTSTVAPSYPLVMDASIYTQGAVLQNAQFGAGTCAGPPTPTATNTPAAGACGPVTFANAVNVAVNGNGLQKTAGGVGWNAGASSSTQVSAGDGTAQIQVESTSGYRMFGLSNGDPDAGYASIKYGVDILDGGALYVYESGVFRGQIGTCVTGDRLRVAVSGGVVEYSRQAAGSGAWTVLYTSTVAPSYPLLLDTSIHTSGAKLQNVYFGAGTCP